jgi:hypothetical protein
MKPTIALLLFAIFLFPFQATDASLRLAPGPNVEPAVVLKLSDLRSAYLLRSGIVHYDESHLSPVGVRQQLQRHFDVVIALLLVTTPKSIETALARLQDVDDHKWSASEQATWRQRLLEARYAQLRRLAAYRDRGLFPLNEGQADHPVPIFVDRHDTACAVGQLMRWSGWTENVATIQRTNNLVYVPEAKRSPVASWVVTSGLTLEEAALIQPGYTPVAPYLISDYEPTEPAFFQGGLKYENFQFNAQNFTFSGPLTFHQGVDTCDGCTFTPTSLGPLPFPATVGFNAGSGLIPGNFDTLDPIGNRWLSIGGAGSLFGSPPFRLIGGQSQTNTIQRILISFDVSALGADTYLTQIAQHSYPTYSGFGPIFTGSSQGQYEMTTKAKSIVNTLLATTNFDETPLPPPGQPDFTAKSAAGNLLTHPNKITVSSTIWLYNGATVDSVVFGFQVVPEPSTAVCSLVGLGLIGLCVTRRRVIA